jgi:hypothetical protein
MSKKFLPKEGIKIGSWWSAADGGRYGYVVTAIDLSNGEVTVLGTDGISRTIDYYKLQYRYYPVVPNSENPFEYYGV